MQHADSHTLRTKLRIAQQRLTDAEATAEKLAGDQASLISRIQKGERNLAQTLEAIIAEHQRQQDEMQRLQAEIGTIDAELAEAVEAERRAEESRRNLEWQAAMDELIAAFRHVDEPARRLRALADARGIMLPAHDWTHLPELGGWIRLGGTSIKIGGGHG